MFGMEHKTIPVTRMKLNNQTVSKKQYVSCNFRICAVDAGHGTWEIENKRYSLCAGDVVLLGNRQRRMLSDLSPTEGIELIVIELEPKLVWNTSFAALFFHDHDQFEYKLSQRPDLLALCREMEQETLNRRPGYRLMVASGLVRLLTLIGREYPTISRSHVNEVVMKAVEYIDANYKNHLPLAKTAAMLHVSPTALSRQFSRCMGMGFKQYVLHKRIEHAIFLLETTEATVFEIALTCGFQTAAAFYKSFRSVTHRTPSDYRRKNG